MPGMISGTITLPKAWVGEHPKSRAAKRLIVEGKDPDYYDEVQLDELNALSPEIVSTLKEDRRIRIVYSTNSSYEPVIANMILNFNEPVNILYAATKDVAGVARGEMILGLSRNAETAERQIAYLEERGLAVEDITDMGWPIEGGRSY